MSGAMTTRTYLLALALLPAVACGQILETDSSSGAYDPRDASADAPRDTTPDAPFPDGNAAPAHRRVVALSAGGYHVCALLEGGAVKCWGSNRYGTLGIGDTNDRGDEPGEMGDALPEVELGTNRRAVAISAGLVHTCALLDDGAVKCWGDNHLGQLGIGDANDRGDDPNEMGDALPAVELGTNRRAIAVAANEGTSCALLDNHQVKCWGLGTFLGQGDRANRGDDPNELGDRLPPIDFGAGRTVLALAPEGGSHTCVLLDDHSVKCWGANAGGQLGVGDGNQRGDDPKEMGDYLATIPLGTTRRVESLAVGRDHTCALLENGTVKCWGYNVSGSLGTGDPASRGGNGAEMGEALPAVALAPRGPIVAVTAGGTRSCVRYEDGEATCWGGNAYGELGLEDGDQTPRGDAPGETERLAPLRVGSGLRIQHVACGWLHTCALVTGGAVKCWGSNEHGALGLGSASQERGLLPGEMGDALPFIDLGR